MLLRTIDALWVDHLTELDDMRRGIGLRGYGGTDPLNEFKREAFKLYEELRGFISKQVANNIFRVQVQQVPQQQTFPMPIPSQFGETGTNVTGAQADQITPVEGGHIHSDGTFHADAPPAGNGNGARGRRGRRRRGGPAGSCRGQPTRHPVPTRRGDRRRRRTGRQSCRGR